jgi:hypothetical protein
MEQQSHWERSFAVAQRGKHERRKESMEMIQCEETQSGTLVREFVI